VTRAIVSRLAGYTFDHQHTSESTVGLSSSLIVEHLDRTRTSALDSTASLRLYALCTCTFVQDLFSVSNAALDCSRKGKKAQAVWVWDWEVATSFLPREKRGELDPR